MRDYLKEQLDKSLVYGTKGFVHGLIVKNPFGTIEDIEYNIFKLEYKNGKSGLAEIRTGNHKYMALEAKFSNMRTFGENISKDPDISFYCNDGIYRKYNLYSDNGKYEYIVDYTIMEDHINVGSICIETSNLSTKGFSIDGFYVSNDDTIELTRTLTALSSIKKSDITKNNETIIVILFVPGYNVPVVKLYDNDIINMDFMKQILGSIDEICNPYDDLLHFDKVDLHEIRDINISSNEVIMKQDPTLDSTIDYNYFNYMYSKEGTGIALKDIEFVSVGKLPEGEYITTRYENLVTKLKISNEGKYIVQYIYDGNISHPNAKGISFPVDNIICTTCCPDNTILAQHSSIVSYAKILKDLDTADKYASYIAICEDEDGNNIVSGLNPDDLDDKLLKDDIHLVLSSLQYFVQQLDLNGTGVTKEYKVFQYSDISGIQFKYLYSKEDDVFAYFDPISRVYFNIKDNNIEIVSAEVIGVNNPSLVFIRDRYGVPIFFD